ncbi:MAG: SDR family NAD(P)-dependent oxidoreductase [Planctomycetaceae bacterium]|nr:SDR family NAD(P)-dependent oxidoreductase [Planctomycetaceae bacterium]
MAFSASRFLGAVGLGAGALLAVRSVQRQLNRCDFRGKTVLITGGSRGLGLVLARQLAAEGADLILCARHGDELERAARELTASSAQVQTHVCDITDRDQVVPMIQSIIAERGRLDVVINNAGIIQTGPLESMTCEDYEEALQTHLFGPMTVNRAVIPHMRNRQSGRIVNISSIGGLISVPHLLPYCTSKFALVGYSLGLRNELERDGIRVTTVCPGLMRTGSPRNATFKGQNRAEYAWFKIASSLPFVTLSAESAARQAIDGCRFGDALVVLGYQTKLVAKLAALAPGLTYDLLALTARLLPGFGGIGTNSARGWQSETPLTESPLTALTNTAARQNNEIPGTTGV